MTQQQITFGELIEKYRKEKKFKFAELAKCSALCGGHITRIERGQGITLSTAMRLMRIQEIPWSELEFVRDEFKNRFQVDGFPRGGKKKPFDDATALKVRALYMEGKGPKEIWAITNIHDATVKRMVAGVGPYAKFGRCERRMRGERMTRKYTDAQKAEVERLLRQGIQLKKIKEMTGITSIYFIRSVRAEMIGRMNAEKERVS